MKNKDTEVLSQIEPDENFFGCLDYSILHADRTLLSHMLNKHWHNPVFKKIISNNLLANTLEKSPSTDFIRYVMNEFVDGFVYEDQEGKIFKFLLEESNE